MRYPYLTIDLEKIEENCRIITALCKKHEINVAGVTKVTCGMPKVARALLRGGVKQIADSRLENIERMRNDGIRAEMMLLRIPRLSDIDRVVELADISLNSELAVIKALSDEAEKQGKIHRIILMIDLGDLREGILPQEAVHYVDQILKFDGVELDGIGTNLACFGGIQPSSKNLDILVYIAEEIRKRFGIPLPIVSGGNTFSLPLLVSGRMPTGITHLRLGASILLASFPTPEALSQQLHYDAFQLHAEIIELKDKPSRPYGETGEDAFGKKPVFDDEDKLMERAILGIGREDIMPEWVFPIDEGVNVLGASSDHLIVDVTAIQRQITVGSELVFNLEYGALLSAMTSHYVYKQPFFRQKKLSTKPLLHVIGMPIVCQHDAQETSNAPEYLRQQGLIEQLQSTDFEIHDDGNLEIEGEDIPAESRNERIRKRTAQILFSQQIPLFLGGPHSLLQGVLLGLSQAIEEFGVICFDADGDLIARLVKEHKRSQFLSNLENYVLVGVRDLTIAQKILLEHASITIFTIDDIDRLGMMRVMNRALDIAGKATHGIHVSFDMDVVDSREAPGVVRAELGGLQYRETHLATEMIADSQLLLSADIAEIVPDHDINGMTAKFAMNLLASLFGRKVVKKR